MTIRARPKTLAPQQRAVSLRFVPSEDGSRGLVDLDTRTARLSFSSEEPVDMWYGTEILSHDQGAVRLDGARQTAMPLLFNHDRDDLLGVVEGIEIGADARGYATVRFGKDERGDWAMQQAADGILTNVSFMYRVFKWVEDVEAETYTATDWEPFEISLVTVPADPTVGVGRAAANTESDVEIVSRHNSPEQSGTSGETDMHLRTPHVLQDKATDGTTGGAGGATVDVDVETIRTSARDAAQKAERDRVIEIEAMCRKHNLPGDFLRDLVTKGASIELARGMVLDKLAESGESQRSIGLGHEIGLTEKEKASYNMLRAINASLNKDWTKAGFEREVSTAIGKKLDKEARTGAFYMPTDLPFAPDEKHARAYRALSQRAAPYQAGTAAQGGNLVATNLLADAFIEVLRNVSITGQLGARYLTGLVGGVDIPRQSAVTSTYWVGESGALTESEATFDKVSLRPKTIGALSKISRLMLLQSTPAIEMIARQDLVAQLALGLDLAALSGSGASNQPTGIVNTSGIGSVVGGTNGANLSFDHLIQLKTLPKVANAPLANLGFALNYKTVGYLETQKSTTGQYLWSTDGTVTGAAPALLKGHVYAASQQLRSTLTKGTSTSICSELIFGNWQELLIGEWGALEILANPYDSAGFANGDVLLRAFQTVDVGVRHAPSFAVMSDALTPGF